MSDWTADLLSGYECRTIELAEAEVVAGEPDDTEICATLVRRIGDRSADARPRRAVLYLHGWNDYFFQTHLGDHFAGLGFDFYALDLRRYGRSLKDGQLPGFIGDLADYDAELDAALAIVGDTVDEVVLVGHSTGGLIAALYAADHPGAIAGLVLNSPWLDLQGSAMIRAVGTPVVEALGGRMATSAIRLPDPGLYGRVLHLSSGGEWEFDTALKAHPSPPVRVGWIRAIRHGHQRVARGLGITAPVLVMAAGRTLFRRRWDEELRRADSVLDVEQIAARAGSLGRHVTIARFDGGIHDLFLSAPDVRREVFAEVSRWTSCYLPARVDPGDGPEAALPFRATARH